MPDELRVNSSTLRLVKGDITALEVEAFVYYARADLSLGSGYGNAISMRGGPTIQEELRKLGPLATTGAVVTSAGNMKVRRIIHAVGPKFQEEDLERKLRETVANALKAADAAGIAQVALPAMGAGFYGVPLPLSARVTLSAVIEHFAGETGIRDVIVCLLDSREYLLFRKELAAVRAGRS
jgi:O-acetyl-ADP-ribose deacetylase (regulator of RNase III)